MSALTEHWDELVAVGLLGTDRRPVPPPPPGLLAELTAEAPQADPAASLLQQVAALTAMRRAGMGPVQLGVIDDPLPPDPRPPTPARAGEVLRRVLSHWDVLEDEWLAYAEAGGFRLAPEHVVPLLALHRSHPERRSAVERLAGPLAPWLVDRFAELAPARAPRAPAPAPGDLALPAELRSVTDADARHVVDVVAGGVQRATFGRSHRAVLVLAVSRVRPDTLVPLAEALEATDHGLPAGAVAGALADLARTRAELVATLTRENDPEVRSG